MRDKSAPGTEADKLGDTFKHLTNVKYMRGAPATMLLPLNPSPKTAAVAQPDAATAPGGDASAPPSSKTPSKPAMKKGFFNTPKAAPQRASGAGDPPEPDSDEVAAALRMARGAGLVERSTTKRAPSPAVVEKGQIEQCPRYAISERGCFDIGDFGRLWNMGPQNACSR